MFIYSDAKGSKYVREVLFSINTHVLHSTSPEVSAT